MRDRGNGLGAVVDLGQIWGFLERGSERSASWEVRVM